MIMNKVSDSLASADKNGKPVAVKAGEPNPMDAFMGETDPVIVQEVLPMIVKMYEIMHIENPSHQGTSIMAGSLNVMYANLCVQVNAEKMTDPRLLDEQVSEFNRAKLHYLRGRDLILDAFDARWPGFKASVLGNDDVAVKKAVANLKKSDVNAVYWACAGSLASFSLDPLDPDALGSLKGPVAMLEKAAELDPEYGSGSIWDVLSQFYSAAPPDFGGDYERAIYCYEQATSVSKGLSAGIFVTYAESFCKPAGDREGFKSALEEALKIRPEESTSGVLMTVIAQQKARRLLDSIDDYFIVW